MKICKWIIDSRAIKHMTSHKVAFATYNVISPHNMHLDDDRVVEAIGIGSVVVRVETRGKIHRIRITDVIQLPKLQANLLNKLLSKSL